jgi:hypothetical protein
MIELLVTIIILGILFWFVETYVPMSEPFKALVRIIAILIVLLLILQFVRGGSLGILNIR